MKASDLTPSKYLKQSDVDPAKLVTIKDVEKVKFEERGGESKVKWAMHFRELDKPLLLNKTNVNRTVKATGTDDTDEWVGKKVVLYFDEDVEFGGEVVGGIRIRAPKGGVAAAPAKTSSRESVEDAMAEEAGGGGFNDEVPFAPLHKRSLWA